MRYLGFILVLLVGLSSCDSREDWFEHNSEGADIVVTMNGVSDTLYKGEKKLIIGDLHFKSCDDINYMYTDTLYFSVEGLNEPMKWIRFDGLRLRINRTFENEKNNVVNVCLFEDIPLSKDSVYFDSDTTAKLLSFQKAVIWATDVFGITEYYNFILNFYGPIPPTPILKTEKLAGEYEYSLSLDDSYDKDGKVAKYEWCIDGNIASYSVTDCRFERKNGNWQSGKAAYGGTYITATTLSSVNHSFQTPGEHTVYYRCMDNMGIWSMWYSKKINVE